MGITAENVVEKYGLTRKEQDAFAANSQRKAVNAQYTDLIDFWDFSQNFGIFSRFFSEFWDFFQITKCLGKDFARCFPPVILGTLLLFLLEDVITSPSEIFFQIFQIFGIFSRIVVRL